ncbi:Jerky like protein-like, partial [Dictyocoela muelleri]
LSRVDSKYSEIDSYILKKITILRNKKVPITRNIIINLSEDYYKSLNIMDKKGSLYYVNNFVKRHHLSFISLHGNSASADSSEIENFKERLSKKLEVYEISNIFNIDETSLFIRSGLNKSYVLNKKNDNKNVKQDKTRLTLML